MKGTFVCKILGHKDEGTIWRAVSRINYFAKDGVTDLSGIYVTKNNMCSRCKREEEIDAVSTAYLSFIAVPLLDVYWPNSMGKIVHEGMMTGADYIEKTGDKEFRGGSVYFHKGHPLRQK